MVTALNKMKGAGEISLDVDEDGILHYTMESYDYLLKIVVMGDGGIGKTAISVRFTQGYYKERPGSGSRISRNAAAMSCYSRRSRPSGMQGRTSLVMECPIILRALLPTFPARSMRERPWRPRAWPRPRGGAGVPWPAGRRASQQAVSLQEGRPCKGECFA